MYKYFDSIKSTQCHLIDNIDKYKVGDVVYSGVQTRGYGRSGVWKSDAKNIYFSKLVEFDSNLWLHVLVCMHKFVAKYLPEAQIKIPNDIYLKNQKVGGFLIDKVEDKMIIGIGINVYEPTTCDKIGIGKIAGLVIGDLVKELNIILNQKYKLEDLESYFIKNSFLINQSVDYLDAGILKTGIVKSLTIKHIVIDESSFYLDQIKLLRWHNEK